MSKPISQLMYAELCSRNNVEYYDFIYETKTQLKMCGCNNPIKIIVTEDLNGKYWGWLDYKDNKISMIYPSLQALDMCFTYGIKAAEKAEKGKRVKLRIDKDNQ